MSLNCLTLYNLKLFQSALVWRLYFIMKLWEDEIPTLGFLDSCTALKSFMIFHLDESLSGVACFQGDIVEFNGYGVPKEGEIIPVDNYGNFTVGTVNEVTNTFVLTLGKFADEAFGVELPSYVRKELIATLKGEW